MTAEQALESAFEPNEAFARALDDQDVLREFRDAFHIPESSPGQPCLYLCGNSLGLQPKAVRHLIGEELDDWARLAVDGHFAGRRPWYPYHEQFSQSGARIVGAQPGEVVMMNSLTTNLHLMMVSFYQPERGRHKILIDGPTFPSDLYAVSSQLHFHGYTAEDALIIARPAEGEHHLRPEAVEQLLHKHGAEIALVLLSGVNYFTGQLLDIQRLARAARQQGCAVGLDLAHAAGNVPLALHDWQVDFAVWCSYKYLNSGPGAVAGCFVHERHRNRPELPRFAGWWGNDPSTRFQMDTESEFIPHAGADGWQLSNPPILALTPLLASLELFDRAGMNRLRAKSEQLTGYLAYLLNHLAGDRIVVLTPDDKDARGCQLSLVVDNPRRCYEALQKQGVVCDFRPPNVIRVAPVPLYNRFIDAFRFADIVSHAQ